jgi:DnaJ-domain-containing protein 1
MRTFGKLREILASNKEFAKRLSELESRYDDQFREVFQAIRALMSERSIPRK